MEAVSRKWPTSGKTRPRIQSPSPKKALVHENLLFSFRSGTGRPIPTLGFLHQTSLLHCLLLKDQCYLLKQTEKDRAALNTHTQKNNKLSQHLTSKSL